jgi:hypothetical protein
MGFCGSQPLSLGQSLLWTVVSKKPHITALLSRGILPENVTSCVNYLTTVCVCATCLICATRDDHDVLGHQVDAFPSQQREAPGRIAKTPTTGYIVVVHQLLGW